MPSDTADRLAIQDLIAELGALARRPHWDRFRTVWHKDGQMWATWFQGSYEDFIKVSQEGYDRGVRIMHMLGGMSIDIKGKRAIAQTKMTIQQRAAVEGVVCDVTCYGKFYDFLEKRRGRWGIVLRRLAYEKDRIDPVEPGAGQARPEAAGAAFRKATAISPICRTRSATPSRTTCPASTGRRWRRSMPRARPG